MAASAMHTAAAKVFKAMAHPLRLQIVDELGKGERCVQDLVDLSGVSFPTVSKHLAQLKEAGVIVDERRGQQIFYSVKLPCVAKSVECAKSIVSKTFKSQMEALRSDLGDCPLSAKKGKAK